MSKKLSRIQIIEVHDFMKGNIEKGPDGFVSYKNGHTDASLAKHFKVSISSIAGVRMECFGKLRATPGTAARNDAELETLRAGYLELATNFNRLVTQLSANKITDVRALAVTLAAPGDEEKKLV